MSKPKARKRNSDPFVDFDTKAAYSRSLEYIVRKEVYVNAEMEAFFKVNSNHDIGSKPILINLCQAKAVSFAVEPKMILPSFLVATSNAMGMASVSKS